MLYRYTDQKKDAKSRINIFQLELKNKKKSGGKDILQIRQENDISKWKYLLEQPGAQNRHLSKSRYWYDTNQERQK